MILAQTAVKLPKTLSQYMQGSLQKTSAVHLPHECKFEMARKHSARLLQVFREQTELGGMQGVLDNEPLRRHAYLLSATVPRVPNKPFVIGGRLRRCVEDSGRVGGRWGGRGRG